MENTLRYAVGDSVIVGSVTDCIFGWNTEMKGLEGLAVTITGIYEGYEDYGYYIDLDYGKWAWDDSCFLATISPVEDISISELDILSLIEG